MHKESHKKIESFCKKQNIEFVCNIPISSISCFKSGGLTKFLIYPSNKHQLKTIVEMFNLNKISYYIIGATSNILFKDHTNIDVLISITKLNNIIINKQKRIIEVDAGVMMTTLVQETLKYSFGGFAGLVGIPGTIGGGIFMNASAYGDEVADQLISVEILDDKNKFQILSKDKLKFSPRHSIFQEKKLGIIVSAKFRGIRESQKTIKAKINRNQISRSTYQESTHPNVGSLFVTKDIYSDLAKFDSMYAKKLVLVKFIRKIYKRYVRRTTNNIPLNYVTCKHFDINYKNRVFSDKTMNCLVNKGFSTEQYLEYINKIQKITKNTLLLENIIL